MSLIRQDLLAGCLFTIWLALVACDMAAGQSAGPPPRPPEALKAFEHLRQGKYLAALATMESIAAPDEMVWQELATLRSFVGDESGAIEAMDRSQSLGGDRPLPSPAGIGEWHPQDAIDAIAEQARGRQIVILNEAHHIARHRAFAWLVAERLKAEGFNYLAMETLGPDVDSLHVRGYPIRDSGFYSMEPVFGDLIRQAIAIGYRIVAYEMTARVAPADATEAINSREAAQCGHLIERIFAQDPQARVLIFVGYSHADERVRALQDGRELAWLAARLARELGTDPLTIDQTTQTERSHPSLQTPEWLAARDCGWLERPLVLCKEGGSFFVGGSYRGAMDLQVFHPPSAEVHGRPDWLSMSGYRRPVAIPEGIGMEGERLLVQAFVVGETDDAVPMDQVIVSVESAAPHLMLPAGDYSIVVQDESGASRMTSALSVARPENGR